MKVKFFINQEDINIKLTDDNIINITGLIGSGKSTLSDKYRNNNKYLIFNLDNLGNLDLLRETKEMAEVKKIIKRKYKTINFDNDFLKYYDIICNYIKKRHDKIGVIEGGHLYFYLSLKDLKGTLIICLPSLFKCWYQSLKRHYLKRREELKNGLPFKDFLKSNIRNFFHRTAQLKYYKKMNKFLNQLN